LDEKQTQQHRQHFNLSESAKQKLEELTARRYPGKQRRQSQLVEDLITEAFTKEQGMNTATTGMQEPEPDWLLPVRKAMQLAEREAMDMGVREVYPEHLLLGILGLSDDGVARELSVLGLDAQAIRARAVEVFDSRAFLETPASPLPLSREAQECIDWAITGAMLYQIPAVNPDHLLLSVLSHHRVQAFLGPLLPSSDVLLARLMEGMGPIYAGYMDQLLLNGIRNPSIVSVTLGQSKRILKTFERPTITFANLVGLDQVKQNLREVVEFLKMPGGLESSNRLAPSGVLLVGPRSSERALVVRAIAGEADVPLLTLSWQTMLEVIHDIEQGNRRIEELDLPVREYNSLKSGRGLIRGLFDQAKSSPCVILIDDVDTFIPTMTREVGNQLLRPLFAEMTGLDASKQIVVVITTNQLNDRGHWMLSPDRLGRRIKVVYLDPTLATQPPLEPARGATTFHVNRDATPTVISTTKTSFCLSCKRPVQLNWKHCVYCGASLARVCPNCGAPRPDIEGARFCFECGSPLEQQNESPAEQNLEQQTESPKEQIMKQTLKIAAEQEGARHFSTGQSVRVLDGPWAGQTGTITEIDVDQRRVTVLVSFFSRETPVVLHFKQVESI
jgi:uncharacterized Zn finger protein (UPF0148 family)